MSVETKETETPVKAPIHQLELTNGAIYLLEGCLQALGACTTPDKIIKWGKCWKFIRAQNDRLVTVSGSDAAIDFEKPILPKPDETPEAHQVRVAQVTEAHSEWIKKPKVLGLSDKRRDICKEAIKYWVAHKEDGKSKAMAMSDNLILLLEAFNIAGDGDADADE